MTAPPRRRHIPGRGPRPAAEAADDLRAMAPERGADSPAWARGLRLIEEGFYWEAHEALEAVWLALPPNSGDRLAAQAVIQIANAGLKLLMGRPAAASRLCDQAEALMREASLRAPAPMRLSPEAVANALARLRAAAREGAVVDRGLRLS